ncbi:MAG: FecR domain-containing protein [Chloroflexi bacterium]|nr:FecR domain-containing protein [Chloroflexota bacterium]
MAYLYICAAPGDQLPAEHLTSQLRQMQHSVFLSGQPPVAWQEMQRQIAACNMVMVVISPEEIATGYCQPQINEAARLNKPIQPVVMRPTAQLPFLPGQLPALDMTQGITQPAVAALQAITSRITPTPSKKSNRNVVALGAMAGIGGLFLLVACIVAAVVLLGKDKNKDNDKSDQIAGDLTGLTIAANVETSQDQQIWQTAPARFVLAEGDSIRTNASGQALLTFFTGDETEVTPNTELKIEVMQGEANGDNQIQLNILVGQITNRIDRTLNTNSRYDVKTPTADAAVRGTIYTVKVEPITGRSTFSVERGVVQVTAQGQTQTAQAGFEIVVEPGQPPSAPRQLPTPTPGFTTPTPTVTASPTATQRPIVVPTTAPSATAGITPLLTITGPAIDSQFKAGDVVTVTGNVQGIASGQSILVELLQTGGGNAIASSNAVIETANIATLTRWQTTLPIPANIGSGVLRIRASYPQAGLAQGISIQVTGAVIPTPTNAPTITPIPSPTLAAAYIRIVSPASNEIVPPGSFTLVGEAGGIFENTFTLQILVNGQIIAQYPVTFTTQEVGGSGRFSVTIDKVPIQPGTQAQLYGVAFSARDGSILTETPLIPVVFR